MKQYGYIPGVLLCAMSVTVNAAEPATGFDSFDMPDIDVTSRVKDAGEVNKKLKQTLSYDAAVDKNDKMITNRIGWRLQWDGIVADNNYVVIDTKLRVFNYNDSQYDSDADIDHDFKINALYLQRSNEKQSFTTGYQVVSLGIMDMLGFVDVVNPWDYSEQTLTTPEDARIGQALFKWSHFGEQQWDIMLNLYPQSNRYPITLLERAFKQTAGTTDYSIIDGLPDPFKEPELIIRTKSTHGKHEQQWVLASLLQNEPSVFRAGTSGSTILLQLNYPRYELLSGSYNFTSGNHQWRFEAAYKNDQVPFDALGYTTDETSTGLGWEYNANGDYNLALEYGYRWRKVQNTTALLLPASQVTKEFSQFSARWNKNFLHETVSATLYAGRSNPGPVDIYSASLSYKPSDNWVMELIYTHVEADEDTINLVSSNTALSFRYYW